MSVVTKTFAQPALHDYNRIKCKFLGKQIMMETNAVTIFGLTKASGWRCLAPPLMPSTLYRSQLYKGYEYSKKH
jgi:hypothetical protein